MKAKLREGRKELQRKHWQACLPTAGLISTRLYNSTSKKMVLFIVKAKRTSNLEYKLTSLMKRGWDRRNKDN
jgi:hypothetical protein